jgi:hypothetical protein
MVLTTWAVWNSHEGARMADVIHRLDNRNLQAVGTLLIAVSHGTPAIDRWIARTIDGGGRR